MKTRGRCWKFGDNIPTDQIVRSDRALGSMEEMARHVLENYNPNFAKEVQPGDILVAGKHFGQSSGRAVAPKAIKATGVGAVVVELNEVIIPPEQISQVFLKPEDRLELVHFVGGG